MINNMDGLEHLSWISGLGIIKGEMNSIVVICKEVLHEHKFIIICLSNQRVRIIGFGWFREEIIELS